MKKYIQEKEKILQKSCKRETKKMDNNKKLIVYYSYTGHTKMIAKMIKKKINCDILEIKPVKEYSKDYNKVVDEEEDNSSTKRKPKIQKIDKDIKQYDEIIIGSPVWWYTIAPTIEIDNWIDKL